MFQAIAAEVFTADEVARAANVPLGDVHSLIASGEVRWIPGTQYLSAADALRAVRRLRPETTVRRPAPQAAGVRAGASLTVHAAFLMVVLWMSAGAAAPAPADPTPRPTSRLVFVMTPGPGGGGGGGGLRNPLPTPTVKRRGTMQRLSVPEAVAKPVVTSARREEEPPKPPTPIARPEPVERAPEPLPSRVLVAPVVSSAADEREREGSIEESPDTAASQGIGRDGGTGAGQGTGTGDGHGTGIGDGWGGGTGGGPYRPGSGITPPRLLREVKAEYTDEARRRGITGDVLLEIVVQRDGSVGTVSVLQGLGAGLDQRAVAAVRQWRFEPARLRNAPVDVVVEVAVEFTLR